MNAFFALLVASGLVVNNYQIGASYCNADEDGFCSWTNPIGCDNPESYCGTEATVDCLVVSKSINASYDSSSGQQFQCRCPVDGLCNPYNYQEIAVDCTTNNTVTIPTYDGNFISIFYAEMWKCSDNSVIDCPSGSILRSSVGKDLGCNRDVQLLPNVLALVRFWCQYRTSPCIFDLSLILSYVGPPNNSLSLPAYYVFEWAQAWTPSFSSNDFQCPKQSTNFSDSCYRLTPPNLEWKDARSYCLRIGGDLAHFTSQIDFASIIKTLDSSIPPLTDASKAIPTWFKWYSWDGEQRMPQHFMQHTDGFKCDVYNYQSGNGTNPLARCYSGKRSKKTRGMCVLPPNLSTDNFEYENVTCPARCLPDYKDCWDETEIDTVAINDCPNGFSGSARWTCGITGEWMTPTPDLSNCSNPIVNDSVNKAREDLENNKDPSQSLNNLSDAIRETELASGNIAQLDETIQYAITKQKELMKPKSAESQDQSSRNFTNSILDLNNILLASEKAFWGLESIPRDEAIDHVQQNVDQTLFLLAENLLGGVYRNDDFQNLAVQVENKPKMDYNNQSYAYVIGEKDQLILPAGFPYAVDDPKALLSFDVFSEFQNLLYGDTLALFKEQNGTTGPLRQILVSKVIGATLGNGSINLNGGKVEILLSTLNLDLYDVDRSSAKCAYWDVSKQDWSFDGCELVPTNDKSTTRCRCDHLTNFAVIMDINGLFQNKTVVALEYITIIGESISIACLTLALIIFYSLRNLRRDFRFRIHRNLCWSLLLAEILLLAGIDATYNEDLCLSIAVFLHFFFLCAFGWMLVEGLYMYFLVTKVFDGSGLKRWQYYIIGYGSSVLVVAITLIATKTEAYQNPYYCWLSYDNGAIWAFAGPVAGVVLANLFFLVVALVVAFKSKRNKLGKKEENNFQWIFGTFSLTFILGITWLFGFLYFNQGSLTMAYVFTILNSLQGLIIFITFCVLNKQVRSELHKKLISNKGFQRVASTFNIKMSDSYTVRSPNSANKTGVSTTQTTNTKTSNGPNRKSATSNEFY